MICTIALRTSQEESFSAVFAPNITKMGCGAMSNQTHACDMCEDKRIDHVLLYIFEEIKSEPNPCARED